MPDIYVAESGGKPESTTPKPETDKKPTVEDSNEFLENKPQQGSERHSLAGHTHNPLAALSYMPDNVQFETQEDDEDIILLLRRHPVTNVGWIVLASLMILAPLLLRFFPILDFLPSRFQIVAVLIWYLITLAFIIEQFFDWFFNVYIVTNKRVIDVDFVNLIYKQVSDANLERIEDVTFKMGGVVRTIFNYGDLYIQTAAEIPNFEFEAIPNPSRVEKILQEVREGKTD